jgi:hypothetical protein
MKNSLVGKALDDLTKLVNAERVEMVRCLQLDLATGIQEAIARDELERPPATESLLSARHLELVVRQAAEHFSEMRRINRLFREHSQRLQDLRNIPSTAEDMLDDWLEACAFAALQIFEGEAIDFSQVEPASYPLLEDVWLKRIKRLKAYYIWKAGASGDADHNYHLASEAIRKLLLDRPRADLRDFQKVAAYLKEHYLADGRTDRLDATKPGTLRLLMQKAERIWRTTGVADPDVNWCRARLYAAMYYENIIGAVQDGDPRKTLAILRAFQFSKGAPNRYLIINGFETAVAISFLDKDIVREVLRDPDAFDFSIEPVDEWPAQLVLPENCRGRVRYEAGARELVCEGVMSEEQRQALLALLGRDDHRQAVERLFHQSRIRPVEETIL